MNIPFFNLTVQTLFFKVLKYFRIYLTHDIPITIFIINRLITVLDVVL